MRLLITTVGINDDGTPRPCLQNLTSSKTITTINSNPVPLYATLTAETRISSAGYG